MLPPIPAVLRATIGSRAFFCLLLLLSAGLPRLGRAQSVVLEQWALTTNNSATLVLPGAVATTPTLSTGTTPIVASSASAPAANSALGQAIAPTATGGGWANASASPITRYEEFTYTVDAGYTARIDSLVFSAALAGGSNGRVGVAYSTDGFLTSANTTYVSGTLSSGTVLNGASLNASNNVTAATDVYQIVRLPLNGGASSGIRLTAGSTVAFRLYYAVSSNSTGRYGLLRGFSVKGQSATIGTVGSTTAQVSFTTRAAGGYTYALTTSPAGGTATLTTAPISTNNYLATYTISSLTANTAYTVSVAGTGTPGNTTITSATFTTTSAAPPCAAATNLAVGSITNTTAQVTFTPGAGNTNYSITTSPATTQATVTTSPANLTGLSAGTVYTVTVTSNCASGTSNGTSTTFTTTGSVPLTCADPTGLAVGSITSTSASLSFTPGASNTSYTVIYYPTATPALTTTLSPAPTTSPVALMGLTPNTAYTLTLQSTCANGAMGTLLTQTFTTPALTCSNATGLAVGSITSTSASFSFSPGSNNTSYVVTYYPTATPLAITTIDPATSPVTLSGLSGSTGYTVTVRSTCTNGATSSGSSRTFTTLPPNCAAPTGVAVGSITSTSASLSFTPGASNTSYTVIFYPTATPALTTTLSPAPTTSPVALMGLTPNTAYTLTLQSTCANTEISLGQTVTFRTALVNQLYQWPLTTGPYDNADSRSTLVQASANRPRRFAPADGSVSAVPSYSSTFGMGFAPTAAGLWTALAGGTGGTLKRTHYTQFAVKPATGTTLRVDSLILSTAFYNTTGSFAVVYSTTGFRPGTLGSILDSVDVDGGRGPNGPLTAGQGGFGNPIALPNQNTNPNQTYRFALKTPGSTSSTPGVVLASGDSLTVRLYYASGSGSAGRYALLQNVNITGAANPLPVTLTRFEAVRQGRTALLTWATASEVNSKGFSVQVSADGREFHTAGFVPSPKANSSQAQQYRFVDATEGLSGARYYRLQQLDLDGTATTTAPRVVVFEGANSQALSASPNPFAESIVLHTQSLSAAPTTVRLLDITGRTVRTFELAVPAGLGQVALAGLGGLPSGVYTLHVVLDGQPKHLRLVKE